MVGVYKSQILVIPLWVDQLNQLKQVFTKRPQQLIASQLNLVGSLKNLCLINLLLANYSRPRDLDLNSPDLSYKKSMNDVERISSLTNFSPNKRSPDNFSILHYTQLPIT